MFYKEHSLIFKSMLHYLDKNMFITLTNDMGVIVPSMSKTTALIPSNTDSASSRDRFCVGGGILSLKSKFFE